MSLLSLKRGFEDATEINLCQYPLTITVLTQSGSLHLAAKFKDNVAV